VIKHTEKCDEILTLLRKITRAIDLHSKQLVKKYGLTGPQLLLLKIIIQHKVLSSSKLADIASLSHPTVTSILDRLSQSDYVKREKASDDKRKVMVSATEKAKKLFAASPSLLQEQFVTQFYALKDWEQSQLISSLSRIAEMMSAGDLDAAPFLVSKADLKE
jgi:DNA-binding MarR family transcriptional regulator